jgi:tetratricopeptide (TPR) repeat protein
LPSPSLDQQGGPTLQGQLVVFTGKLSSLGRKDARALVARLGGSTADDVNAKTTMLVVGAEGFRSEDAEPGSQATGSARSNKLKRVDELNAGREAQIEVLTEDQFCRLTGVTTPDALKRQYHAMRDLMARYRALREDHVRYLVKCGVIRPVLRTNADVFFAFPDLAAIKQANDELDEGASFRSVVRGLLASREGQLELDFRLDAAPAKIIALTRRTPPAEGAGSTQPPLAVASFGGPPKPEAKAAAGPGLLRDTGSKGLGQVRDTARAEEFFRRASSLDDGDEAKLEEASAAYRKALELDPYLVAALINLANVHYGRDELAEAQALYERAIGLESDFFEAHFNLGNIYHDLARFAEAQACYCEALRLNPYYADTHFYLAVTCEKMGLSQDARPHWRAYQQLAPNGEWVELAREFSE